MFLRKNVLLFLVYMKKSLYLCTEIKGVHYRLIRNALRIVRLSSVVARLRAIIFTHPMKHYILWLLFGDRDRSLCFLAALLTDLYLTTWL